MFESYLSKIVLTLAGSFTMFAGIAGGYYTLYQLVTLAGN